VISSGDLYCCLLPWCEALRICRSGFPIATAEPATSRHFILGSITLRVGLSNNPQNNQTYYIKVI